MQALVKELVEIRREIAELEYEHELVLIPLKLRRDALQAQITEELQKMGVLSQRFQEAIGHDRALAEPGKNHFLGIEPFILLVGPAQHDFLFALAHQEGRAGAPVPGWDCSIEAAGPRPPWPRTNVCAASAFVD